MVYLSLNAPPSERNASINFKRKGGISERKHLLSSRAINSNEVDDFCRMAEAYESDRAPLSAFPGRIIALLFFQPSTRTRLGFEVAAVALGSHAVGIEDMSASRSNAPTGESVEDCAAVVSRLCDAIV